uniref:Uncharacterized protein n=1 Tax=Sphaerodactylus townsendi TaxID=933632 RepID=A0ACB8ESW2_9SAUR
MQPMDQDIYSEWDPAAQSEWSWVQVQAGAWAWAPEQGVVAWRRERDGMWQEIHFLQCNMELLLARAKAAERDQQDPPQLSPPPLEGEQPVPAPPNNMPPGPQGPPGPPGPQPQWRWQCLKAHLDGTTETLLPRASRSTYGERWLGLCLSCGGEGHKAAVCPSKKPDPLVVPASGAAKTRTTKDPERKSPFKKGSGLQVELRKASSASEEVGSPESSEELVGNNSNLA